MKLKAKKNFQDMQANVRRVVGDIFEVTDERGNELLANPNDIVEKLQDVIVEESATHDLTPPLKTPEQLEKESQEAQAFNRKENETKEENQNNDVPQDANPAETPTSEPQQEEQKPVGNDTDVTTSPAENYPSVPTEKVVETNPEVRPEASIVKSKSQIRREAIMKKKAEAEKKPAKKRRYAGAKKK